MSDLVGNPEDRFSRLVDVPKPCSIVVGKSMNKWQNEHAWSQRELSVEKKSEINQGYDVSHSKEPYAAVEYIRFLESDKCIIILK